MTVKLYIFIYQQMYRLHLVAVMTNVVLCKILLKVHVLQ